MSKKIKIWLIVASLLILFGAVIFSICLISVNGDFMKISTSKFQTNEYQITESFESISITTDTANIEIVPSNDSTCSVKCVEKENRHHLVSVKDKTLVIELVDTRKWYEHIDINFRQPSITISLPQGYYEAFAVKCQTGNIKVEDLSVGSINLKVTTGNITAKKINALGDFEINVVTGKTLLSEVNCNNLTSNGTTGDVKLEKVVANGIINVKRNTGDICFDSCDAVELLVKTTTGDVKGTLLSSKIFIIDTSTGKKDVPKTTIGGKCEITTTTGDVIISIKQ